MLRVWKANFGIIVLRGDNAERYQNILTQFSSVLEGAERVSTRWGDMPHCKYNKCFTERNSWKGTVGHGLWPPRSPDFIPPDFLMLGFLKEFIRIDRDAWINWNTVLERVSSTLIQKHLANS